MSPADTARALLAPQPDPVHGPDSQSVPHSHGGAMAHDDTGFDAAPSRYMATGREAIDIIRDELGDEGAVAFCLGNARKYELRAGHKGSAENDHEKARWYREFAAFLRGQGPDPRSRRGAR